MEELRKPRIVDREDEYKALRRRMIISPVRMDPFEHGRWSLLSAFPSFLIFLTFNV